MDTNITYFKDIYCLNSFIKLDKSFCAMPIYLQYEKSWAYLQYAITYFQYDCHKDLLNYTPYYFQTYKYDGDGLENEFMISPAPTREDTNIYISIKKEDEDTYSEYLISDYEYDIDTNVITLKEPLEENALMNITFYADGYFNSILDLNEKVILAEGMNRPFLEQLAHNKELLIQIVYGGNTKIYSQAEHMKQTGKLLTDHEARLNGLIIDYSYRAEPLKSNDIRLNKLASYSGNRITRHSRGRHRW